jgi:hypothetical protein
MIRVRNRVNDEYCSESVSESRDRSISPKNVDRFSERGTSPCDKGEIGTRKEDEKKGDDRPSSQSTRAEVQS